MILERISSPNDVKRLSRPELDQLAAEVRETLIRVCAANGGHLAPNLGVVELTIALMRVLDLPKDVICWDVSHQSYVHKLLTGRYDRFHTLRQAGGISGFSMRTESEYDAFGAGHASTAISSALGMATARDLAGRRETVVAVIGDGAMTGGLAYEAINNAGLLKTNFLVILNDNEMSIAPNVGSIASYLGMLRSKPLFTKGREFVKEILDHVPLGETARRALSTAEMAGMRFSLPEHKAPVIFEEMGFRYIGPVDGHDLDSLTDVISNARKIPGPVLLHVKTVKGKGFDIAEGDSRTFHGVGPGVYHPDEGKIEKKGASRPTHNQAFADALIAAAERDRRIVGITAAMPDGTGLAKFAKRFPDRYFDVGIAEAHAVCFAAGASTRGIKPVCAIYSTFLQRAYDQVIHDVVIQQLPVVLALDRAGFVGDDGPTHMGLYDIAYLRTLPGLTIMAPRNEHEIGPMLDHALSLDAPVALRYPRGSTSGKHDEPVAPIVQGKGEVLREGTDVAILALGNTVDVALDAYDLLAAQGIRPTVVNARFVDPLDEMLLLELAETHRRFLTLEEHSLAGGFGSAVVEFVNDRGLGVIVERIGVPNVLVQQGSQAAQRAQIGLSAENVAARVRALSPSQTA
ncbi:MAG TPA: 1-deoxy-D-xylulose-5-phosphate synthase [Candidatus Acidoferrum sp.]|nr:1-deoxy-D-xylulose-5-phosphate synthase [Candidatus Acidoferrum sp.]